MPAKCAPLAYEESFTVEESAHLRTCVLPGGMEDKWIVLFDDFRLSFHRSWTGFCIYAVTLVNINEDQEPPDVFCTSQPIVNRDPDEYTCTDDAYDARLLSWLIRTLMLHQEVEFPVDPTLSPEDALITMWGLAGNAAFTPPPTTPSAEPDRDAR